MLENITKNLEKNDKQQNTIQTTSNSENQESIQKTLLKHQKKIEFECNKIQKQIYQEKSSHKRIKLANTILEIDPQFVEAIIVLGNEAKQPKQALKYFQKAVNISQQKIEEEILHKKIELFWFDPKTRVYMKSKYAFAWCLWKGCNRKEEALKEYYELLSLSYIDLMGIRHYIVTILLEFNRFQDVELIIKQYANDLSTTWKYTTALLNMKKVCDFLESRQKQTDENFANTLNINKISPKEKLLSLVELAALDQLSDLSDKNLETMIFTANNNLKEAFQFNIHVPLFLLGKSNLPVNLPKIKNYSKENEAIEYVWHHFAHWYKNPYFITWLDIAFNLYTSQKHYNINHVQIASQNFPSLPPLVNPKEINFSQIDKNFYNDPFFQFHDQPPEELQKPIQFLTELSAIRSKYFQTKFMDFISTIEEGLVITPPKQKIVNEENIEMDEKNTKQIMREEIEELDKVKDDPQKFLENIFAFLNNISNMEQNKNQEPEIEKIFKQIMQESDESISKRRKKANPNISKYEYEYTNSGDDEKELSSDFESQDLDLDHVSFAEETDRFFHLNQKAKLQVDGDDYDYEYEYDDDYDYDDYNGNDYDVNQTRFTMFYGISDGDDDDDNDDNIDNIDIDIDINDIKEYQYSNSEDDFDQEIENENFLDIRNETEILNKILENNFNEPIQENPNEEKQNDSDLDDHFESEDESNLINLSLLDQALEFKQTGNEFFKQKDWENAIFYYTKSLRIAPLEFHKERSVILANQAACFLQLQDYQRVIQLCNLSLHLNPEYLKARFRRAKAYYLTNKPSFAEQDLVFILQKDQNNKDAQKLLIEVQNKIKEEEQVQNEQKKKIFELQTKFWDSITTPKDIIFEFIKNNFNQFALEKLLQILPKEIFQSLSNIFHTKKTKIFNILSHKFKKETTKNILENIDNLDLHNNPVFSLPFYKQFDIVLLSQNPKIIEIENENENEIKNENESESENENENENENLSKKFNESKDSSESEIDYYFTISNLENVKLEDFLHLLSQLYEISNPSIKPIQNFKKPKMEDQKNIKIPKNFPQDIQNILYQKHEEVISRKLKLEKISSEEYEIYTAFIITISKLFILQISNLYQKLKGKNGQDKIRRGKKKKKKQKEKKQKQENFGNSKERGKI
ncbi:protein clmp1 [Anaeramoeba ignava]|uniref:Protein clmp1 n=1 Tax=Anaeramoeba ignava TaxID=1746090 RepID=A0A9Q0L6D1_ANAIG|nr:protein clmp1 [Anaeramoeba ignava]